MASRKSLLIAAGYAGSREQANYLENSMTKLHFWTDGDPSCGIGRNETVIELDLDGYDAEETADNIAHAKEVLSKALNEIWDNGTVHVMTEAELHTPVADEFDMAKQALNFDARVLAQAQDGRLFNEGLTMFKGPSGLPKSALSDFTPTERAALNEWSAQQIGDPERGGVIDLMRWPGWAGVIERRAKERSGSGSSTTGV